MHVYMCIHISIYSTSALEQVFLLFRRTNRGKHGHVLKWQSLYVWAHCKCPSSLRLSIGKSAVYMCAMS